MELSGVMVTFSSPPSAFSGMVRVNTEPSAPVVARVPPVTGIRAVAALVPSSVTETLVGCGTTRLPLVPPAGPVEPAGPWSRRSRRCRWSPLRLRPRRPTRAATGQGERSPSCGPGDGVRIMQSLLQTLTQKPARCGRPSLELASQSVEEVSRGRTISRVL